jgi:NAD+ synthase (glutamine-hydrolysing)
MIITIAQLNPYIGDIAGNLTKMKELLSEQSKQGTELLVFPELFLVGYPPKGLLERAWFIAEVQEAVEDLRLFSQAFPETGILFGAPRPTKKTGGKSLVNAAILLCGGEILLEQAKTRLPAYDLFDETRYFAAAEEAQIVAFRGEKLGITIGEDAWNEAQLWPREGGKPVDLLAALQKKGATLFLNLAASPFYRGKEKIIAGLFSRHAEKRYLPLVYVNQVGANDELVFEGRSFGLDEQGNPLAVLAAFQEQVVTINTKENTKENIEEKVTRKQIQEQGQRQEQKLAQVQSLVEQVSFKEEMEGVYGALVLGIKDYFCKSGLQKALIGLSGGIDSALVCCLAVAALGKENVLGISMPSPFSSEGSVTDSRSLAENLGIGLKVISISQIYQGYLDTLQEHFAGKPADLAEENLQARIRGNLLMAFSNKFGYLLLTTGNKSELSVGYCTLYGDMSGGLAVLADLPKTMVYQLSYYVNRQQEIIPLSTLEKAPSAELRPDQKDQDSLPPYELLDKLLHLYLEEGYSPEELVQGGYDAETANWVVKMVERNEYKRRQAVMGLKVNTSPFQMDRRMPVAAKRY